MYEIAIHFYFLKVDSMNFNHEKNGYNIKQVDDFLLRLKNEYDRVASEHKIRISDLKRENEALQKELSSYKKRNNNISDALVVAVETAKQIENSSKNVYELEIKRIRSLYTKWENFLNELMQQYPSVKNKFDTEKLLSEFNNKIDEIIKQNSVPVNEPTTQSIGIRNLISKMGGLTSKPVETKKVVIKRNNANDEVSYIESQKLTLQNDNFQEAQPKSNLELKIKPIANMKNDKDERFNSLVDKFLTGDTEEENAYSKALIRKKENKTGFDLKEALNPTEDLASIMKDFDFFDDKGDK